MCIYIETVFHKLLFDFGKSSIFAENATKLGVYISAVDTVIISHGHYDHEGGLSKFLSMNSNEAVEQANKLNEAKMMFKTIIMYGIAGKGGAAENAVETAEMINQFVTSKVITMNLTVFYGTELSSMVKRGEFI